MIFVPVDPNDKEATKDYPYSNREYVPAYNVKDAIESFDEFGCLIMTNLTVETRKCVHRPYRKYCSYLNHLPNFNGSLYEFLRIF